MTNICSNESTKFLYLKDDSIICEGIGLQKDDVHNSYEDIEEENMGPMHEEDTCSIISEGIS